MTQARVALTSAIYGLSKAELTIEGPADRWSVKDLMAHIARWEEVCLDELQRHMHGEQPTGDYRDALLYNDQWESELSALTLQESIEMFENAHYRLFGLLSSLTPGQWDGYIRAWVRGSTWHHFEEHAEQIRSWRASRQAAAPPGK